MPPATTADAVREQLGDRVDYVIDGGPAPGGGGLHGGRCLGRTAGADSRRSPFSWEAIEGRSAGPGYEIGGRAKRPGRPGIDGYPAVSAEARIDGLSERVVAAMRALIDARTMPLYRMMAYHHGWEDRQENPSGGRPKTRLSLRGAACLAACEAAGGATEAALPAAVGVELIESSFQVHDDVQSGSPQRDGRDSVWWDLGARRRRSTPATACTPWRAWPFFRCGDSGAGPAATFEALGVLDAASLEVCEGRFEDLDAQETDRSERRRLARHGRQEDGRPLWLRDAARSHGRRGRRPRRRGPGRMRPRLRHRLSGAGGDATGMGLRGR